jgi:hypothetical protein
VSSPSFESQLLEFARRRPDVQHALRTLTAIHDMWRAVLNVPDLDQEKFIAKLLHNGARYATATGMGLTFDPIWFASVLIACAPSLSEPPSRSEGCEGGGPMTAALRYYANGAAINRANAVEERAAERRFVSAHHQHIGHLVIADTTHHCRECRVTFTRGAV